MNKTIELPDEIYERLERHAQSQAVTLPEAISRLIEEVDAAYLAVALEKMRKKGILAERQPAESISTGTYKRGTVCGKPISELIVEERR